ncbi:uncharacterized protein MELLADRAFT_61364 [Melampsora larici-populina 98AG31]|uniref:Uncharacterized protein n=1 Tax=Melampsora larici-populina (strain 98AG31 / pathotype 3-4-7) TaxID=747676 RepID=F4REL1_MELLP|nr:uncharacterized protein MELLADRAFT_61364 [Melampsora larici-populina 98AG31]EGG09117.1 hypothetical protein MELLADRAFT_61364 [Melampsora larici-populina 98AG31]
MESIEPQAVTSHHVVQSEQEASEVVEAPLSNFTEGNQSPSTNEMDHNHSDGDNRGVLKQTSIETNSMKPGLRLGTIHFTETPSAVPSTKAFKRPTNTKFDGSDKCSIKPWESPQLDEHNRDVDAWIVNVNQLIEDLTHAELYLMKPKPAKNDVVQIMTDQVALAIMKGSVGVHYFGVINLALHAHDALEQLTLYIEQEVGDYRVPYVPKECMLTWFATFPKTAWSSRCVENSCADGLDPCNHQALLGYPKDHQGLRVSQSHNIMWHAISKDAKPNLLWCQSI